MLRVKMNNLDAETKRRQQISLRYRSGINNPLVTLPQVAVEELHVWHLFVVRCELRESLQQWLTAQGVQTLIHYPVAPHKQPAYSEYADKYLPLTELIHQQVISLPLYPTMSDDAIEKVITAINDFNE